MACPVEAGALSWGIGLHILTILGEIMGILGRLMAGACLASTLTGCVATVYPDFKKPTSATDGYSYDDAVDFIQAARKSMYDQLKTVDGLQQALRLGVAGGVTGAAAGAAFKAPAHVILGFLTGAAVSYSASTQNDSRTSTKILTAGLKNLDCIESAGEAANGAFTGQQLLVASEKAQLEPAVAALQAAILAADRDQANATRSSVAIVHDHAATLNAARPLLSAATDVLGRLTHQLNASLVGGEMVHATRITVLDVDEQIRDHAPDISAIAQSGTIIGNFVSNGAGIQASAGTAGNSAPLVAGHAGIDTTNLNTSQKAEVQHAQQLEDDITGAAHQLQAVLQAIAATPVPQVVTSTISACQTQAIPDAPLVLAPFLTPLDITAGGAPVDVAAASRAMISPRWTSAVPIDLNWSWNQAQGALRFTAPPTAKSGSYLLRAADYAGHVSPEFTINVHAAAPTLGNGAADAGNGQGGAGNGNVPVAPPR